MSINIQTRDSLNNASMLQPAPTIGNTGLTLRPVSLGSLELLRAVNNPLAGSNATESLPELDTTAMAQYLWIHAAPINDVIETIYNRPSDIAKSVAIFAMQITPADLRSVTGLLQGDLQSIEAASAAPEPREGEESPNELPPL